MANMPPCLATPAQDIFRASSLMSIGVQGSTVATPQPNVAVEVKREGEPDGQAEDGGYVVSSCAASSLSVTCIVNSTAGNAQRRSML